MAEIGPTQLGTMLIVASLVAMVSRRIGLPYTAGLVLAGIGLAYFPVGADLPLSRELIFNFFLPPLIFEAAMQLRWSRFRTEMPITIVLAFLGVAISAAVVAGGMHLLLGWSVLGAAFFGVLIAATDPVSVIAAFKEMRAEPRLSMVVESESLLNDGVAAVGFAILVGVAKGEALTASGAAFALLWTVAGGLAIGAAIGFVVLTVAGRTTDHLVEVTLTTVVAWGSFLLAEHVHASGVFAALAPRTLDTAHEVMRLMREAGRSISFDPNLRPTLWPSTEAMREAINALAARADWVLPGLEEGRLLTGADTPEGIAAFYRAQGAQVVVVKLGPDGAYFSSDAASGHVPGFPVAEVVDTVGAGDGFAVGVISALLAGRTLPEAVRRGAWIGARAVQVLGDTEGLPTQAQLQESGL